MRKLAVLTDRTPKNNREFSHHWKDWLRRIVCLFLLVCLIFGIGISYERKVVDGIFCSYSCSEDEVPIRFLREYLNGRPDYVYPRRNDYPEQENFYDEYYPIENPYPEDDDHYYAMLLRGSIGEAWVVGDRTPAQIADSSSNYTASSAREFYPPATS